VFLLFHVLLVFSADAVTCIVQVLPWANIEAMPHGSACAVQSTQNYKDNLYETNVYFSYLISSNHRDINYMLTLQELKIPPSFSMYLLVSKGITVFIF